MRRAEGDKKSPDDSEMNVDDDALATKGDGEENIELHDLRCNGTEDNSGLIASSSSETDITTETSMKVTCDTTANTSEHLASKLGVRTNTIKLLLSRGGLYVIAVAVLIFGGVLSTFHPSVDGSEFENCSVTVTF